MTSTQHEAAGVPPARTSRTGRVEPVEPTQPHGRAIEPDPAKLGPAKVAGDELGVIEVGTGEVGVAKPGATPARDREDDPRQERGTQPRAGPIAGP